MTVEGGRGSVASLPAENSVCVCFFVWVLSFVCMWWWWWKWLLVSVVWVVFFWYVFCFC